MCLLGKHTVAVSFIESTPYNRALISNQGCVKPKEYRIEMLFEHEIPSF